jgi:hypothetical protein
MARRAQLNSFHIDPIFPSFRKAFIEIEARESSMAMQDLIVRPRVCQTVYCVRTALGIGRDDAHFRRISTSPSSVSTIASNSLDVLDKGLSNNKLSILAVVAGCDARRQARRGAVHCDWRRSSAPATARQNGQFIVRESLNSRLGRIPPISDLRH